MSLVSEELMIGGKQLKNRFIMAPVKTTYSKIVESFYPHSILRELPVQMGIHLG
jgi:2,4-dienoyl-CoA reductase-like NADH-dependent reductase (Old Yellow Enzyme family)